MKDQKKMKQLTIQAALAASMFTGTLASYAEAPKKDQPNIILFLVDDMGWQDTSVPFWVKKTPLNEKFNTPGMERLASQGMVFTQAYASSVCSPSRVSLMSGMNAARHRVTNWTLQKDASVDGQSKTLTYPQWNVNGMQPENNIRQSVQATAFPKILREHGYFTIHAGKAHFGSIGTPGEDPLNLGFDINIAGHAAGGLATYQGLKNFGNDENGHPQSVWAVPGLEKYFGKDINLTDALTREARLAMDKALEAKKPFFLYLAHYAVHIPLEPDNRFYKKYKDMGYLEPEARYASMVEGMDKSLNDLMDYLEEKDLTNNTIILFMSDNGGLSAHVRGGEKHKHNLPLNSGKGSAYEGGIREPMIVKWPGKVKAGSRTNDYLIIEDFFPTILEMAEIKKYKTVQAIDGKSFVPMLLQSGTTAPGRDLFWHFPNNWGVEGPGIGTTSTIRSGNWKLIYFYEDQHFELYNIQEDIGELTNQAGQQPQKVKELAQKLGNYLRSVDAQRPSLKATGQLIAWPDENL